MNRNVVALNPNSKKMQFVEDGYKGKNQLVLEDFEIKRVN
jgi:hypothetical protein